LWVQSADQFGSAPSVGRQFQFGSAPSVGRQFHKLIFAD
jgi:hypothetical protein